MSRGSRTPSGLAPMLQPVCETKRYVPGAQRWSNACAPAPLRKTQNRSGRPIHLGELRPRQAPGELPEATEMVDGGHLVDDHPAACPVDLDDGSEGTFVRSRRGGGDDPRRQGRELVGLEDNCEPSALLLMAPRVPRCTQPIDVTTH